MLKVRILSDIHLDHGSNPTVVNEGENILVIAGDLCNNFNRDEGVEFIRQYLKTDRDVVVLYVLGNHEYYGGTIAEVENFWNGHADCRLVIFGKDVKKFVYTFSGKTYRFVGCTLWTDLKNGQLLDKAADCLNDFSFIRDFTDNQRLYLNLHVNAISGLKQSLSTEQDLTIILTHHPPFENSVVRYFQDPDLDRLFYSELKYLLQPNIRYWIHGHVHSSCDYIIENCQVVCNPFFENPKYHNSLILHM